MTVSNELLKPLFRFELEIYDPSEGHMGGSFEAELKSKKTTALYVLMGEPEYTLAQSMDGKDLYNILFPFNFDPHGYSKPTTITLEIKFSSTTKAHESHNIRIKSIYPEKILLDGTKCISKEAEINFSKFIKLKAVESNTHPTQIPQMYSFGLGADRIVYRFNSRNEGDICGIQKLALSLETPQNYNIEATFSLSGEAMFLGKAWPLRIKKEKIASYSWSFPE